MGNFNLLNNLILIRIVIYIYNLFVNANVAYYGGIFVTVKNIECVSDLSVFCVDFGWKQGGCGGELVGVLVTAAAMAWSCRLMGDKGMGGGRG